MAGVHCDYKVLLPQDAPVCASVPLAGDTSLCSENMVQLISLVESQEPSQQIFYIPNLLYDIMKLGLMRLKIEYDLLKFLVMFTNFTISY